MHIEDPNEDEFAEQELEEILDEALDSAAEIADVLLAVIKDQDLLGYYEPAEAVLVAKELWDGVRSVAAGVVSADLALAGIPIDLTFMGQYQD
jgi:hypothetical protein